MQRKKKLNIGSSNFKNFIEADGYFVDKTLLIQELIDTHYEVLLIPRPRRFGKSMNLSMLKYYFDIAAQDSATLFEPFKIWQAGDFYTAKQGKHPVIHLSLKGGKATDFAASQQDIYNIISKTYHHFEWLRTAAILKDYELIKFNDLLYGKADATTYKTSLRDLSEYLYRYYGEKVLILMDEYDAPIHTGFYHGYYNQSIELMKSLMGNTFKENDYIYKGVITGILRIAKESIFSDLNNPGIFSILSHPFADKFGFTEVEVQKLLAYYELSKDFEQVKKWYDGYTFGNTEHIYNPWSIINHIARHTEGFKTWWVNTSSDELIKTRIVEKEGVNIRESIEQLVQGKSIYKVIDEDIIFANFDKDKELLWSLLTFCGYLSPVKQVGSEEEHELRIPNYEIKVLFKKIILEWFAQELKVRQTTLRAMVRSLTNNHIEDFKKYFKKIMADTFSYFDTITEPERVYQAYLLGLLGIMSDDYIIKSNRESGTGRYDILLLPRVNTAYGVIMEIKQLKKGASKKRIKAELSDALQQIKKHKYHKELTTHQVHNQIEMAIVFVGKEAHVEVKSDE